MTETTPDKPYHEMSGKELEEALKTWESHVENASGWASAHFAAKQVEAICAQAKRRGTPFENKYPIKVG